MKSYFNKENSMLTFGDKVEEIPIPKDSDQYISYRNYITKGIEDDIKTYLMPVLESINETLVTLKGSDTIVKSAEIRDTLRKRTIMDVKLCLKRTDFISLTENEGEDLPTMHTNDQDLPEFSILKLPTMDRNGILYYQDKRYYVIPSIVMGDSLTFNSKELKLSSGSSSSVIYGNKYPRMKVYGDPISMVAMVALFAREMYPEYSSISYNLISSIRDIKFIQAITGSKGSFTTKDGGSYFLNLNRILSPLIVDQSGRDFKFKEKDDSGIFNISRIRNSLNEILSFDRAVGRTLSKDVSNNAGEIILREGTVVNSAVVGILNDNRITTIFVSKQRDVSNLYLAEYLPIGNVIPKGTPVIPEMIALIPELEQYHITGKKYELDTDLVLTPGTELTTDHNEFINFLYSGSSIKVSTNAQKKPIFDLYFEEEFMCNRHYPNLSMNEFYEDQEEKEESTDESDGESDVIDSIDLSDSIFVDENGRVGIAQEKLTCYDIAALLSLYLKLIDGEQLECISDPDAGLRKKVSMVGDYMHLAFVNACKQLKYKKKEYNKILGNISKGSFRSDAMTSMFQKFSMGFFKYMRNELECVRLLEYTNPVATVSSLTKANVGIKNADSVADSVRYLTMGHYGRLCPYETPQSKKLGLVNNKSILCKIEDGVMKTPYYKVEKRGSKLYVSNVMMYYTVEQEENYRICDLAALDMDTETREIRYKGYVIAKVPNKSALEKVMPSRIPVDLVDLVSVDFDQSISFAGTTIPFVGSDDAVRVTFELSMAKQSKGLINGEIPRVCTRGFLSIPNFTDLYKTSAESDGSVLDVKENSVDVRYNNGIIKQHTYDPVIHSHDSVILRNPVVSKGERVKKGQTLVSSNYLKDGIMVTGVNALIAFCTDGYNHEDGVSICRRLSRKLTSYGVSKDVHLVGGGYGRASSINEKYDTYLEKDDRMYTAIQTRDGKASDVDYEHVNAYGCKGYLSKVDAIPDENKIGRIAKLVAHAISFDEFTESDKVANRHGNKGVDCKVYKNSEMDHLSNGEFLDIKYNYCGIPSRMNTGQVLEAKLGLACHVLDIHVLSSSFKGPSKSQIKYLISYAYDLANTEDYESVFSKYGDLPKELHEHSRLKINAIQSWKGVFDERGRAYLYDPETGKQSLNKVDIGINYIYKLEQEGEGKLNARGGGFNYSYLSKLETPPKGKSSHGGQKLGHMEIDALMAYGASSVLEEVMNERSDNVVRRYNMHVSALHSGATTYKIDPKLGIRRSLEYVIELYKALGVMIEDVGGDSGLNLKRRKELKVFKEKVVQSAKFEKDTDNDKNNIQIPQEIKNVIDNLDF